MPKVVVESSSSGGATREPKRFKSSYICFSIAHQEEVKKELGPGARVGDISKRMAEKWKSLDEEGKRKWDEAAKADRARYEQEKAAYKGPTHAGRRAKKDPNAPKRPMSAFLYFSQKYRPVVKESCPNLKNTEISKKLGEMWRNAPAEERNVFIDREAQQRALYKQEMAQWKKGNRAGAAAVRRAAKKDEADSEGLKPAAAKKADFKPADKTDTALSAAMPRLPQVQAQEQTPQPQLQGVSSAQESQLPSDSAANDAGGFSAAGALSSLGAAGASLGGAGASLGGAGTGGLSTLAAAGGVPPASLGGGGGGVGDYATSGATAAAPIPQVGLDATNFSSLLSAAGGFPGAASGAPAPTPASAYGAEALGGGSAASQSQDQASLLSVQGQYGGAAGMGASFGLRAGMGSAPAPAAPSAYESLGGAQASGFDAFGGAAAGLGGMAAAQNSYQQQGGGLGGLGGLHGLGQQGGGFTGLGQQGGGLAGYGDQGGAGLAGLGQQGGASLAGLSQQGGASLAGLGQQGGASLAGLGQQGGGLGGYGQQGSGLGGLGGALQGNAAAGSFYGYSPSSTAAAQQIIGMMGGGAPGMGGLGGAGGMNGAGGMGY